MADSWSGSCWSAVLHRAVSCCAVCRHWANLEYGCSAALSDVSLPHWNQDEEWGGFGGPHAMVVGGFDVALKGLAAQLGDKLRLSCPVSSIDYSAAQHADEAGDGAAGEEQQQQQPVKVRLGSGEVLEAALVLVTVPLGVLQQGGVEFTPALPDWKAAAAKKLGFGNLNKVVMQVRGAAACCLLHCERHLHTPQWTWQSSMMHACVQQRGPGLDIVHT